MSYMTYLHDWNITSLGPIDEILEPLEKNRQTIIAPIQAMLEGPLYIHDKQRGLRNNIHSLHLPQPTCHVNPLLA
jgi:hypothetical protein